MRKAAYIAAVLGLIIYIMGPSLTLHHIQGGSALYAWGTLFNEIIVLPVITIYLVISKQIRKYILSILSIFLLIGGWFSKIQHWPASMEITALGVLLFCVSTVLLAVHLYNQPSKQI